MLMKIGANYLGNGTCEFVVWAPFKTKVELKIILPEEKIIPMQKDERGYWKATVIDFSPDHLYLYRLDDEKCRPDPASHFQPRGVHGPSQVIDHAANERRKFYLIAESSLNDAKIIRPRELGGFGMDAQWCDDFHHSLRTLVTGENRGYYVDFGRVEQFVKSWQEGFVYSGQYSHYRKRRHGNSSKERPANQFVVFSQNHDQVGNRMLGERLATLISFEALKLAAGAVVLSPYVPMLFMGEEYGEEAPFLYFVSHADANLIAAVRKGRKEEFKSFNWIGEPPDPQSADTFLKSKINWEKREQAHHKVLLDFYKQMIKWRDEIPALANLDKEALAAIGFEEKKIVLVRRRKGQSQVLVIFNFNNAAVTFTAFQYLGAWRKILDSSDKIWRGPGALLPQRITPGKELRIRGHSFAVFRKWQKILGNPLGAH